ncbi:transposase [Sulfurisphaera javensis]
MLCDFSHFSKAEKFVAYCGLDPVTERKASYERPYPFLSL